MALTPRRRRQGSDGAWRPSLLNASGFPVAETTGTANFAYGFAWGIRTGLLPCVTHHHCPGLWLRVLCRALLCLRAGVMSFAFLLAFTKDDGVRCLEDRSALLSLRLCAAWLPLALTKDGRARVPTVPQPTPPQWRRPGPGSQPPRCIPTAAWATASRAVARRPTTSTPTARATFASGRCCWR